MKTKFFAAMIAILLILGFAGISTASNTAEWDITFNVLVEPRVEKAESNCVLPASFQLNMIPQELDEKQTIIGWFEAFYANVPTVITVVGDNPANDGLPIPARAERHGPGAHFGDDKQRWDRLSITMIIMKRVNEGDPDSSQEAEGDITFVSPTQNSTGVPAGAGWLSGVNTISLPTSHNGDVEQRFDITVDRKPPDCEVNNEWYESADAGVYSFSITETVVGQDTLQSSDAY